MTKLAKQLKELKQGIKTIHPNLDKKEIRQRAEEIVSTLELVEKLSLHFKTRVQAPNENF